MCGLGACTPLGTWYVRIDSPARFLPCRLLSAVLTFSSAIPVSVPVASRRIVPVCSASLLQLSTFRLLRNCSYFGQRPLSAPSGCRKICTRRTMSHVPVFCMCMWYGVLVCAHTHACCSSSSHHLYRTPCACGFISSMRDALA